MEERIKRTDEDLLLVIKLIKNDFGYDEISEQLIKKSGYNKKNSKNFIGQIKSCINALEERPSTRGKNIMLQYVLHKRGKIKKVSVEADAGTKAIIDRVESLLNNVVLG